MQEVNRSKATDVPLPVKPDIIPAVKTPQQPQHNPVNASKKIVCKILGKNKYKPDMH